VETLTDIRNTMAGWYFVDGELSAAIAGNLMLNVSLDLSNVCNLNCPYCFIEEKDSSRKFRFQDELTLEETLQVVDNFAAAGAKTVNIVGAGEPTVDPIFEIVIKAVFESKMIPVVFTNGIRLAELPELVDFLYVQNATVVLKFDALDPLVQDLAAGRKGYTQVRDCALKRLINRGFAAHLPTRLALDVVAFQANIIDIPKILRRCRTENFFPIIADYIPTGRTEHGVFAGGASITYLPSELQAKVTSYFQPLNTNERNHLHSELVAIDRNEFGIEHESASAYYSGGRCTQILGLYVDIHGNIWPCVARSHILDAKIETGFLGNIRSGDSPLSIWRLDPWIASLRSSYSGHCPYKPQLTLLGGSALSCSHGTVEDRSNAAK
jgi:MoaA/NifB/PqqE/SkfB family radical SAM enzyme